MFSTLTEFNETSVSTPVKVTETKIMQFILVKMYIFLLSGLYFWLFFFFFFVTYYTVSSEPLKVLELFCKIHTTFRRNVTNYQKISSDYHTLPIRFFSVKCQVHDCFELNSPPSPTYSWCFDSTIWLVWAEFSFEYFKAAVRPSLYDICTSSLLFAASRFEFT